MEISHGGIGLTIVQGLFREYLIRRAGCHGYKVKCILESGYANVVVYQNSGKI